MAMEMGRGSSGDVRLVWWGRSPPNQSNPDGAVGALGKNYRALPGGMPGAKTSFQREHAPAPHGRERKAG